MPFPRSAVAAPITVGYGTPESCTEAALQEALATAGLYGGGTIDFSCSGGPVTITLTEGVEGEEGWPYGPVALRPPNDTTIDGGGLITLDLPRLPDGDPDTTIVMFVVRDTTVVLKNLTITGPSRYHLVINAGTLTVEKSTFSGNGGWDDGIYNAGTLTITDSDFSGNRAESSCEYRCGRGINNEGTLTIKGSNFLGNSSASWGGGIRNGGRLTINHSVITNNTAEYQGGGIYTCCGGTMELKSTSVTGNTPDNFAP